MFQSPVSGHRFVDNFEEHGPVCSTLFQSPVSGHRFVDKGIISKGSIHEVVCFNPLCRVIGLLIQCILIT